MIDWRDDGTILTLRRHGETDAIVDVFTLDHGRHAGVVKGGGGRRLAPVLQPGQDVALRWQARLDDHLGTFTVEPVRSRAHLLADRDALAALTAVTALLSLSLPDREPHPALFQRSRAVLDLLDQPELWPLAYLQWEVALLAEMGFALDLTRCAVTGATADLAHVSPRTGRAVSRAGAGDWADRLLPLPPVLRGEGSATSPDIAEALGVTGYFLTHRLLAGAGDRPLPPARARLVARLAARGD